jgi:hypothetical protein
MRLSSTVLNSWTSLNNHVMCSDMTISNKLTRLKRIDFKKNLIKFISQNIIKKGTRYKKRSLQLVPRRSATRGTNHGKETQTWPAPARRRRGRRRRRVLAPSRSSRRAGPPLSPSSHPTPRLPLSSSAGPRTAASPPFPVSSSTSCSPGEPSPST